jgi:hypothetical protein
MIAMIVGFSVTAVSCSPESTSPARAATTAEPSDAQAPLSLQEQYAWTGKYHNDALAYATAKINESKKIARFDKCKVGLAALKDFQKAFRKAGGNAVFDDLTITDGMCEAAASLSNPVAAARNLEAPSFGTRADISTVANDYMNQISYEVDVAPSVEYLSLVVSKIVNQAGASVGSLEAPAVATTGSVAVSSAGYWTSAEGTATDNGPAPYARSSNQSIQTPGDLTVRAMIGISPRTKRIIKADVGAAISVLLKEWFTGEAAVAKACITAAAASLIAGLYFT